MLPPPKQNQHSLLAHTTHLTWHQCLTWMGMAPCAPQLWREQGLEVHIPGHWLRFDGFISGVQWDILSCHMLSDRKRAGRSWTTFLYNQKTEQDCRTSLSFNHTEVTSDVFSDDMFKNFIPPFPNATVFLKLCFLGNKASWIKQFPAVTYTTIRHRKEFALKRIWNHCFWTLLLLHCPQSWNKSPMAYINLNISVSFLHFPLK